MAFCAYCGTQLAEVSYTPCPNCGNPSNGAPRGTIAPPPPSAGGSKTAMIIVAVLIGGFVLVAVIGILAAIAIPNLLTATQRSKQKRTMADVRSISTAVEAYATDKNQYPNATSMETLRPLLAPTYIRDVPSMDGWGHALRYEAWSRANELDSYAVGSAGKDGVWEHDNLRDYTQGPTQPFDCDIVYSNGNFVQYPGTTQ
jgi:type II secretory pathway pseudopilin PulG